MSVFTSTCIKVFLASQLVLIGNVSMGEDRGLSDEFETVRSQLNSLVEQKVLPNVAALVVNKDDVLFEHHHGVLDAELGTPVQRDSLFRIYSMTKSVTAVAAMMLVEEGVIELDAPISHVLPEFSYLAVWGDSGNTPANPMTLRHLLAHTSGLTYGYYGDTPVDRKYREVGLIDDWDYLVATTHDLVVGLGEIPLLFQPGDRFHYGFSSDVVSQVIERVSGVSFDVFLNDRLWGPLGVPDAYFDVPDEALERFGTNHYPANNGAFVVQDSPREDPEFREVTFLSGGGGLVMTNEGFARLIQLLLADGTVNGKRLLGSESIEEIVTNQLPESDDPSAFRYSLGFGISTQTDEAGATWDIYYWGGAAGTSFWVDFERGIGGIFMTQLIGAPGEPASQFRNKVYQVLFNQSEYGN